VILLIAETFPSMNAIISCVEALSPGFSTIYARGRSSSSLVAGS
jgi:hypothetical protein